MRPGIFIGLGSTGTKTVAHVKANLQSYYHNLGLTEQQFRNENVFQCIDTDKDVLVQLAKDDGLRNIIDEDNEMLEIGKDAPLQIYEQHKTEVEKWADSPKQWPNTLLSEGAEMNRQIGRSILVNDSDNIIGKIQGKISDIQTANFQAQDAGTTTIDPQSAPFIWVFSSGTGGTGSSILLDVLYYIDRAYKVSFNNQDAYTQLVLFMARPFVEASGENKNSYLNSFCTYKELNMLYEDYRYGDLNFKDIALIDPNRYTSKTRAYPFKVIYPIDNVFGLKKYKIEDLPRLVGNITFQMHIGSATSSLISNLCNDIPKVVKDRNLHKKDSDAETTWLPYMAPIGMYRVEKPNDSFRKYVERRLLYEVLQNGLLGKSLNDHYPEGDRMKHVEKFAKDNILKYILSEVSVQNDKNIERDFKDKIFAEFFDDDAISISKEDEKKLTTHWAGFSNDVNDAIIRYNNEWKNPEFDLSQNRYFDKIKENILKASEPLIIKYGLKYLYDLLDLVDDKYLTKLMAEKEIGRDKLKEEIEEKETKAVGSSQKNKLSDYKAACGEFVKAKVDSMLNEFFIDILDKLTNNEKGFLEILRKEKKNGVGLQVYIDEFDILAKDANKKYKELAKEFAGTKNDVSITYVPSLADMVAKDENTWVTNNVFSHEFSNIIKYDESKSTNSLGDYELLRHGKGSIESFLAKLHNDIKLELNKELLFCNEDILFKNGEIKPLIAKVKQKINRNFIFEEYLGADNNVILWLQKSLEAHVNDLDLLNDDKPELAKLSSTIRSRTELLFGRRTSSHSIVNQREIYYGQTENFARNFGYSNDPKKSYIPGNNESLFMKIRIVPGFTFMDYNFYDVIKGQYDIAHKNNFADTGIPYIHKGLIRHNSFASLLGKKRAVFSDVLFLFIFQSVLNALKSVNTTLFDQIADFSDKKSEMMDILTGSQSHGSGSTNDYSLITFDATGDNIQLNLAPYFYIEHGIIRKPADSKVKIEITTTSAKAFVHQVLEDDGNNGQIARLITELKNSLPVLTKKAELRNFVDNNKESTIIKNLAISFYQKVTTSLCKDSSDMDYFTKKEASIDIIKKALDEILVLLR